MSVVSVIIPSFNTAHHLPDAINSIIQQTYTNWELIVVDDGSTDDSVEIIKKTNFFDKLRIVLFVKKITMDKEIYFHVGLSKTASTYLQNRFFNKIKFGLNFINLSCVFAPK